MGCCNCETDIYAFFFKECVEFMFNIEYSCSNGLFNWWQLRWTGCYTLTQTHRFNNNWFFRWLEQISLASWQYIFKIENNVKRNAQSDWTNACNLFKHTEKGHSMPRPWWKKVYIGEGVEKLRPVCQDQVTIDRIIDGDNLHVVRFHRVAWCIDYLLQNLLMIRRVSKTSQWLGCGHHVAGPYGRHSRKHKAGKLKTSKIGSNIMIAVGTAPHWT